MTFSMIETKAKVARIKELAECGLNTPRMFFLKHDASDSEFDKAFEWVNNIFEKDPNQIFNIRTYTRERQKETVQTEHITDVDANSLYFALSKANMNYHCMIDAETPDDGRLAGNIVLITSNHTGKIDKFILEYSEKEKRAMVRDEPNFSYKDKMINFPHKLELLEVLKGAFDFIKKDVILEWTWFCKPAGILQKNLVWWEYRRWE